MAWRCAYILVLLVIAGGGCMHQKEKPPQATTAPSPQITTESQPLHVPSGPQPVVEGTAPLVYLTEAPAVVRVLDTTANKELLKIDVPAKTLLAVHQQAGIRVGGATMKMGPLPAGHRFAIYLESKEPNVIRRSTVRPGVPQATTRHGGAP